MDKTLETTTPDTFEGTTKAREFIARLAEFFDSELHPLAREHGIDHENAPSRELLEKVWKRSHELQCQSVKPLTGIFLLGTCCESA